MKIRRGWVWSLLAASLVLAVSPVARAGESDKSVVDEILSVLRERGDLDQAEYERLVARNADHEKKAATSWTSRISLFGDLRARYEGFWLHSDQVSDLENRERGRYRARIGATATINDYVSSTVRLSSGEGDNRSAHTSFGRSAPDFNPDDVYLDIAQVQLRSKEGQIPVTGGVATAVAGKMQNPFLWKIGQDNLLFDPDITPEGLSLAWTGSPWKGVKLWTTGAWYVIDENFSTTSVNKDPKLLAAQLGAELGPTSDFTFGLRTSWYGFRSLDASFVSRGVSGTVAGGGATTSAGNLSDGLTGSSAGDGMDVGEASAYATWAGFASWPITVYGTFATNFSAEPSSLFPGAGRNPDAWMVGVETGDKTKWLRIGAAFAHLEANAFPSMFVDSDLFDGTTNREGWVFYGSKQILPNTDINLALFASDGIEDQLPAFAPSLAGSKRLRAKADLEVKF